MYRMATSGALSGDTPSGLIHAYVVTPDQEYYYAVCGENLADLHEWPHLDFSPGDLMSPCAQCSGFVQANPI